MTRLGMLGKEDGLTLLELLVVATIIGVLVLIVVGVESASSQLAGSVACQENLRLTRTSLKFFYQSNCAYPSELNQLVPSYVSGRATKCPASGQAYNYDAATGQAGCPDH